MRFSIIVRSVFAIVIAAISVNAQVEWEKYYGGSEYEFSQQLIELSDHNLLLCGYSYSFGKGSADIWLLKVKPTGDTLWTRTYGGKSYDCATAVLELPDGNLLVAGNTTSFAADSANCAYDVWLLKLKSDGDTLWTKTFKGSNTAGVKMAVDATGNIFLAANSIERDPKQDVQIIKCDSNGGKQWVKYFGGNDLEDLNAFCKTSDGSLLLLTTSQSFGDRTMLLFKLNSAGDSLWSHTYGNFNYGNASDIVEMPNGSYMLSGYSGSTTQEPLIIRNLQPGDGGINWEKSYPEFSSNYTPTFHLLSSGNLFLSAIEINEQEQGTWVRLIRLDGAGEILWTDRIGKGGGTMTYADDFLETSNGKFMMLGTSNKLTRAADDIWLTSLTPDMYVNMGGVLEYKLVDNADSLNYTYTLVRGPTAMQVSAGGAVIWSPQTTKPSSELVEVAVRSSSKTDTIGFVLYVNKKGSVGVQRDAMPAKNPSASFSPFVQLTKQYAAFSTVSGEFRADIYTMQGKRVVTVKSGSDRRVVWNLRDGLGNMVPNGTYAVRFISGKQAKANQLSIMR